MLRQMFCSHLVMAGVSLCELQLQVGRCKYSTTEVHAQLSAGSKLTAVKKINL
jgi:site-specific recombinase XerD